jgi:hypothetical protein
MPPEPVTDQFTNYAGGAVSNSQTSIITLNSNNQVIKRDFGAAGYNTYSYDKNGNITTISTYRLPNTTSPYATYNYAYDDKKSRFLDVKGDYYIYADLPEVSNNILTQNPASMVPASPSYSYIYQYNSDDYPTSRILSTSGVTTQTTQVFRYTTR